ncbi:cytolytic toxin-alpha-like [Hoplias malabaricus]|uniref:cytolytic toxin-alpha-like n=1 Tax=Hoplias malabaricus TaxID=27720 RepID=UPI00346299A7
MEYGTIEMAALGRYMRLGMLYDCRRDFFIPGVTLWDKTSLNKDVDSHNLHKTDLRFSASETLSEKTSLLDLSASLKASFLGGLVEVSGSARYLNDKKSSPRQSRVTLQYSQTTRFDQLTMTQLGKITYPDVFEERTATHVVTAILYGGHAFMVFDKTASENENKQDVDGKLHVMVKKLKCLTVEGDGAIKMNEKEKELAENINCTFYGDYNIDTHPTTYMEAVQLFKTLPSLLKQRENDAVPVKVWLYPLANLDQQSVKIERNISSMLVSKIEGLLEDLENAEMQCSDLVKDPMTNYFQHLLVKLKTFQKLLVGYKLMLQNTLQRLIPAIRGGEETDQVLFKLLEVHDESPFTADRMQQFLENMQSELDLLKSYTKELSGVPVIPSLAQFNKILFDPMVDKVVCFSFTSLTKEDSYLSAVTEFLKVEDFEILTAVPESIDQDMPGWFNNPEISERMKDNLFLFKSFSDANKSEKKTRFVIASISDASNPGASILLHKSGKMLDSKFQPVSKPPAPIVEIQNTNVLLKMQKPSTGETVRFRVEHRVNEPDQSGADDKDWETTDTPDAKEQFTLTGLELANEYWVRYRAVSDVGVSEASDFIKFSLQGKINIPVGQSLNETMQSFYKELSNKITTSLGTSYWSLSTIQREVTDRLSNISIPYVGTIPGGLRPEMALYFQGVVHPQASRFSINLKTGQKDGDDIAFHFNPRMYSANTIFKSQRNGHWEKEEVFRWCPTPKGSAFDIFFVIRPNCYEVYVNGRKFGLFDHSMPISNVITIYIEGDVCMNTTGIVAQWKTSTFGKELHSGMSRHKDSNIPSQELKPVCSPSKTYNGPITGGLSVRQALYFQGVVPSVCDRFAINLKCGPAEYDNFAFHFNPRFWNHSVVCNSLINRSWGPEEVYEAPFVKGGAFDLFIVPENDGYRVIVNGHVFCTYKHRIPLEKVSYLYINGDVFMNMCSIVEVDNINMKLTPF